MIYELRTYGAIPGEMQSLNQRFANITMKCFGKHGINTVEFWTEDVVTSNTLVRMLTLDDMADRNRARIAIRVDSERIQPSPRWNVKDPW